MLGLSIVDKAIPKHNTQKEILAKKHEAERKERRVSTIDTREKKAESGRTQKEIAKT